MPEVGAAGGPSCCWSRALPARAFLSAPPLRTVLSRPTAPQERGGFRASRQPRAHRGPPFATSTWEPWINSSGRRKPSFWPTTAQSIKDCSTTNNEKPQWPYFELPASSQELFSYDSPFSSVQFSRSIVSNSLQPCGP